MALSRKFLKALGIDEEKIEEIITAHTETVDGLKAERDKYKDDAEKLPEAQKELEELRAKAKDAEPYKEKYESLKKEYDGYREAEEKEKVTARKKDAYKSLLKEAGVLETSIDAILKVTDLGKFELGEDGKVKDAEEAKKAIATEWSGFIGSVRTKGAETPTPPAPGGGEKPKSRAAEIAKSYHRDLYGETKGAE